MRMEEERPARLIDLPTNIRGFCFHDADGEEFVVLNARLTREQNAATYEHERRHIRRGEMFEPAYHEYMEESS